MDIISITSHDNDLYGITKHGSLLIHYNNQWLEAKEVYELRKANHRSIAEIIAPATTQDELFTIIHTNEIPLINQSVIKKMVALGIDIANSLHYYDHFLQNYYKKETINE